VCYSSAAAALLFVFQPLGQQQQQRTCSVIVCSYSFFFGWGLRPKKNYILVRCWSLLDDDEPIWATIYTICTDLTMSTIYYVSCFNFSITALIN
jgi:hypothetical protein